MSFTNQRADDAKQTDQEFEEVRIKDVHPAGKFFEIVREDGWVFGVDGASGVVPKPGSLARFYGKGLGFEVRGLDIDGQEVFYISPGEAEQERQERRDAFERKEREEEAVSRAAYAERLAADPLAFDWDREGPSEEAAAALDRVKTEEEFRESYSGQSWRYAFRLWKATAADPDLLDGLDTYAAVPGVKCDDLSLSGFMEGWARNAVRQMRGKLPKPNGAVLTLDGDLEQNPLPSRRSPLEDMKAAMG